MLGVVGAVAIVIVACRYQCVLFFDLSDLLLESLNFCEIFVESQLDLSGKHVAAICLQLGNRFQLGTLLILCYS